jgi:photosystem II stability/assembly factor-like uncharacterized protein
VLTSQAAPAVATEFSSLHFRSIGPATMSGRIAAVAVYEANPAIYYVATAHGGVWKTTSNGTMFTPLLQHQGLMSTGAVTISQKDPNLVWVGGGESNNRQSTSWGDGIYMSTDGGTTFTHMGLRESRHINRIVLDPTNTDIVFVAATGPLFGSGGERGVYKSTDGGASWKRTLHINDETGANDIVMSPTDSKVLFATTYQRRRTTCCFNGGGEGSALHVSRDGGETWSKVEGGFPTGPLGRLAVDIAPSNASVVYALVEAPAAAGQSPSGLWRSNDAGATWAKVNSVNPRPMYFSKLKIDPIDPERVYYGGVGLHVSHDGGKTVEPDAARVLHDDVHAIWINPRNTDHVLIGNDGGLGVSYDAAKTWQFIPNVPVGLFYHAWYDMETPFNVCGGMQDNYNWCGPSRSRFGAGIMNYDWFQILGGDGFVAMPDPRDSRIIYTESQDGNMIRRNKITGESKSIRPTPQNVSPAVPATERFRFHWDSPMTLSAHEPGTLIVAANRVFRSSDRGDSWTVISPDLTQNKNRDSIVTMGQNGRDIRLARNDGISQWPAIVSLAESPKQAGVIYTGTDDGTVSVTRDNGKTWTNITANLPGFPAGAFVSEVVPSRFDAGTVYITVDNHRENDYTPHVWASTDFGATFRRITNGLTGEIARTLTEDTRNANVLYIGGESGIWLSLDKGANWRKLSGDNFPNVRVDELTIHPRDNALIVASHGRSIWILDDLSPIQEYNTARTVADVALFSVPNALQWKYKDDRNDEFWGHQTFIGENPPVDATIRMFVNKAPDSLAVRISSGTRVVRELAVRADSNFTGIQTVCWDLRGAPIVSATPAAAPGGRGPGGGGGGGGGGGPQAGGARIPGLPTPLPSAGYKPSSPCRGGGGGGGFGGGGGAAAPYVSPGDYTVSLIANGKVLSTKTMKVVMDPQVQLSGTARVAYDALLNDLHARQQRGTDVATRLTTLASQIAVVKSKLDSTPSLTAANKTSFAALEQAFDSVRVKFGVQPGRLPGAMAVPPAAGPGGGGGGFGAFGGAANTANVLGRLGTVKGAIAGIWETPSSSVQQQATATSRELDVAIAEANRVLASAQTVGRSFTAAGLTLGVP